MLPVLFKPRVAFGPSARTVWGRLNDDIDRLFGRCLAPVADTVTAPYRVDAWEDETHVHLAADVPGMTKDDIEISVRDGILTLAGHRKDASEHKQEGYHVRERRFGKFERRFRLPEAVDESDVKAILKDGVLTISLSKRQEVKPRKIEVKGD